MSRFVFFSIVSILLITSCSNDDTDQNVDTPINTGGIAGKWNLINISGGFIGINQDFEKGIITWEFNTITKKLMVVNTNTDEMIEDSIATGTYDYTIEELNTVTQIIVNNNNLGNITIEADQFMIDEQFRDGFKLTFIR